MTNRNFVAAILVNNKNEVLLMKKGLEYKWFPGYWAFFGGGIEQGETPEQALKRELKEELNININNLKLFKEVDFRIKALNKEILEGKGYYFVVKFDNIKDISLNEGKGFAFFDKQEIKSLKMNERDSEVLKEYFEQE